jgi:hypothetical protein
MTPAAPPTYRCGVCLIDFDGPVYEALRYLITHMNELQESLEFELVNVDSDDLLIECLTGTQPAEPTSGLIEGFAQRQDARNRKLEDGYGLLPDNPDGYVVVSLAQLSNRHYLWGFDRTSVLALGAWNRSLAPPSLVEAIVTFILQVAGGAATPAARDRTHLGTKGCLFDFNVSLPTARYKVLNSFICRGCREAMVDAGQAQLAKDLRELLGKYWLGKATDPIAPAGICRKLGYDLYLTKGVRPTFREAAAAQLQGSWVGELLKVAGIVLAAALVLILGIKGAG